jgi:DNA-directed RNA polymerase specialized sigma24 family protein
MSSAGSVTHWISQLKAGDQTAAQHLWERYFQRLVGLARTKLHGASRGAADEEDVALSAFDSFYRGVAQGRFPQLLDRDDLWQVLLTLTTRKAADLVRHEGRRKRGGSAVRGEPALPETDSAANEPALDHLISREPSPAFAAQVAEECQRLLDKLGDAELRALALLKMEGYTNDEIARRLGRAPRTVKRRLQLIRRLWEQEKAP